MPAARTDDPLLDLGGLQTVARPGLATERSARHGPGERSSSVVRGRARWGNQTTERRRLTPADVDTVGSGQRSCTSAGPLPAGRSRPECSGRPVAVVGSLDRSNAQPVHPTETNEAPREWRHPPQSSSSARPHRPAFDPAVGVPRGPRARPRGRRRGCPGPRTATDQLGASRHPLDPPRTLRAETAVAVMGRYWSLPRRPSSCGGESHPAERRRLSRAARHRRLFDVQNATAVRASDRSDPAESRPANPRKRGARMPSQIRCIDSTWWMHQGRGEVASSANGVDENAARPPGRGMRRSVARR
jgi:hypothetical protein